MLTYTIPQIVEQRICIAPMSKEQFEIFKQRAVEYLKIDTKKYDVQYFENYFYVILDNPDRILCSKLNMSEFLNTKKFKASCTIQFSQIDFEENKVENPNGLFGKKCKGFKFDSKNYNFLYAPKMDDFIDKIGIIIGNQPGSNSYVVEFDGGFHFAYPAELIHLHLVEEENEANKIKKCLNCGSLLLHDFCDQMCEDEHNYIEDRMKEEKNNDDVLENPTSATFAPLDSFTKTMKQLGFEHNGEYKAVYFPILEHEDSKPDCKITVCQLKTSSSITEMAEDFWEMIIYFKNRPKSSVYYYDIKGITAHTKESIKEIIEKIKVKFKEDASNR